MHDTQFPFAPQYRERESLTKIDPEALEGDTVECRHGQGTMKLAPGATLTLAKDLGAFILAWTEEPKTLVLVEKTQLGEELPWV